MAHPLIRKLEQFTCLSADDQRLLERLTREHVRRIGPREDIVCEGDEAGEIHLILSGWACRSKQLEDGRGAILGFLLPGDLCDLDSFLIGAMDHSVGALTTVTVAGILRTQFDELMLHHARIAKALWGKCSSMRLSSGSGRSISASAPRMSACAICCASCSCVCGLWA